MLPLKNLACKVLIWLCLMGWFVGTMVQRSVVPGYRVNVSVNWSANFSHFETILTTNENLTMIISQGYYNNSASGNITLICLKLFSPLRSLAPTYKRYSLSDLWSCMLLRCGRTNKCNPNLDCYSPFLFILLVNRQYNGVWESLNDCHRLKVYYTLLYGNLMGNSSRRKQKCQLNNGWWILYSRKIIQHYYDNGLAPID